MRKRLVLFTILLFVIAYVTDYSFSDVDTNDNANITSAPLPTATAEVYTVSNEGLFESEKERFVAHRGFSDHAPENSYPAFELAGKAGFWGIESDIMESADGVFMCMHDDTLDRTTTGTGKVSDYSYTELMDFNIDYGNDIDKYPDLKIPTMVEFLNACVIYDCVPIIEIKNVVNYESFLQTIKNSGLYNRCIVTGNLESLKEIRKLDKDIPIMLLAYATLEYSAYEALLPELETNYGILLNAPLITKEVSESLHSQGCKIGAWTLDTPEDAKKYIELGADFVVTNQIPGLNHMINDNE